MSEYIKREDAIKALTDCPVQYVSRICNVPSADVVEVVRCKDCKYGEWKVSELDNKTKGYKCIIHAGLGIDFGDNGYCSYGKRKDNE